MKTNFFSATETDRLFRMLPISGLLVLSLSVFSQERPFTKIYSGNLRGGTTLIGNTLTHIVNGGGADTAKMNAGRSDGNSLYGNDYSNIQYVDIDGAQGAGAATRNSSSADLQLPAGINTIRMALLYWGGKVRQGDFDLNSDTCRKIKIRFGNDGYREFAAMRMDQIATGTSSSRVYQYQACADITAWVRSTGSGTYTVGHAPLSLGSAGSGGNYGGWCLVVVYENSLQSYYNNVRVYDGFQQVYNDGTAHVGRVLLTGLTVTDAPVQMRDARLGAMVWEGDANLKQDYLKINGIFFQNGINTMNNPWNGTISDTGNHVRSKYPDYVNQMGIDIDQFHTGSGYGISSGDTAIQLEFGTASDQFFTGLFTFQVRSNDPVLQFRKDVSDADGNGMATAGEELTYTLRGSNTGSGKAFGTIVIDTLPSNVTFVPGSIRLISHWGNAGTYVLTDLPGDDRAEYLLPSRTVVCRVGSGADFYMGGVMSATDSFTITFRVLVRNSGEQVVNRAFLHAYSASAHPFSLSGTAVLSPIGGPLPVSLLHFRGTLRDPSLIALEWATENEWNASHFSVERSTDGIYFSAIARVAAAGNTDRQTNYSYNDPVGTLHNGTVWYRLVQTDRDGIQQISRTVRFTLAAVRTRLDVFPNPFSSSFQVTLQSAFSGPATFELLNATGTKCLSRSIQLIQGSNRIQFDKMEQLPAGQYILQCTTPWGRHSVRLIHIKG